MWRRGLEGPLPDLSIEEGYRFKRERQELWERLEAEAPVVQRRIVYELVEDDVIDVFVRRFLSDYLVRLGNCEYALRLGFVLDSWSKRNGKCPKDITRFLSVNEPFDHIELKVSYLKNARFATANGCYGIRGLNLKWDTAIWSLLREIECAPCANPFVFPNCARLSDIIADLEFRPEASVVSKALCRASVGVQYAVSILYGYDRAGSIPRYLRSLIQEFIDLNNRIRHISDMTTLNVTAEEVAIIQDALPERVAERLGIPFSPYCHKIFLADGYYECVEAAVDGMFDRLCGCSECGMRRSEKVVAVRARTLGDDRGLTTRRGLLKKKRRNRFFEENVVGLSFLPEMGRLRLPKIRHLDLVQQEVLCRHIGRDLMFDCIFGACRGMSRIRGVPIPFCSAENLNLDLAYILYLACNCYFLAFIIKHVYEVLRYEERAYRDFIIALVRDAAQTLREDVHARVIAGAETPVCVYPDVRDPGLSAEDRDIAIARVLEGLTFDGYDVVVHEFRPGNSLETKVGGFCRDAAIFLDVVEAYRVPKALRENRARGELLAHTLGIRRMYDGRVLSEFHGEKLVPYHLFFSGHWRRDARALRNNNVTLLDEELVHVRRDDELFIGHVGFYDHFEDMDVIREIPVKKRTFMMELQKMYVSKDDVLDLGAEIEQVQVGHDDEDDDEECDEDEEMSTRTVREERGEIVVGEYDENAGDWFEQDDDDNMMSALDNGDDDDDSDENNRFVVERLEGYRT